MLIQSALVALLATAVGAVKPLEVRGVDLVEPESGNRFQVVGIAYQPGGSSGYDPKAGKDPLSNPETCLRDAALMQVMGVNTIRVYNLDPDLNHDECASIFNAAGMYMILDVNSPLVGEAITSFEPWTSYYAAYLNRTFAIVEAFSNYPNTLMFFSGNEVINDIKSAQFVPPYLRAVTRDLKNYIKNNIKRKIPVGYSAADVRDVLWDTWNYMQCSEPGEKDDESRADVFALNSYSWCGKDATFQSSTYDKLVSGFKDTSVPLFFSEFGCIEPKPRFWNEIKAIYGDQMTPIFSGGMAYEWTEEDNGYGLVQLKDGELQILGDYNRLKDQYSKLDWKSLQSQPASKKTPTPPQCTTKLIQEDGFDSNFTLPVVPPGAQTLIDHGISPKPSGKLVKISNWNVKLKVKDASGNALSGLKVVPLNDDQFNWYGRNAAETGSVTTTSDNTTDTKNSTTKSGGKTDDDKSASSTMQPMMWAVTIPLLAMIFA